MALAPARRLALAAFSRARRNREWVRDALRACAEDEAKHLGQGDRALAWRLALGAAGARAVLENRVREVVRKPSGLEPRVWDVLLLGAFELGYLETPVPVAVDQWVSAATSVSPRSTGLANAVLRKLAGLRADVRGARARLEARERAAESGELALASGLPLWLVERLREVLGNAGAARFCLSLADPAPMWLVKTSPEASEADIAESDLDAVACAVPGLLAVGKPAAVEASSALDRGFSVEDRSAYEIALLSVPAAGASRLEIGCGRGTKTLAAATRLARSGAGAELVGVDDDGRRLAEARERAKSAGMDVDFIEGDGRELDALLPPGARFDVVFVDAPCSGTGTLRRHPEIAAALEPSALDSRNAGSLPALQLELLEAAAGRVGEGGWLLYATCSVLTEENEDVVEAFLRSPVGRGFEPAAIERLPGYRALEARARAELSADGFSGVRARTSVSPKSADGHFLAVFRGNAT